MKGLYLGCSSSELTVAKGELQQYQRKQDLPLDLPISGEVVSLKTNGSLHLKELKSEEVFFCIAGWFLYKDKLNDIDNLFTDLLKCKETALNQITGGNFVALLVLKNDYFVFNDPMGMSNHYYLIDDTGLHLSPSLKVFAASELVLNQNKTLTSFLKKRGHLFGINTIYNNVYRMAPGSVLESSGKTYSYIDLLSLKKINTEDVPKRIAKIVQLFPESKRQIPISGGLDSRLMITEASFSFAYCFGPEHSGDRPIARKFSEEFKHFEEFSFADAFKYGNEKNVYGDLCETPSNLIKPEFLASYRFIAKKCGDANIIFDGYLGDALQRGVWMYLGGIKGELYRFFPILYKIKKVDAKLILARRYRNLSDDEFALFYQDFCDKTDGLNLSDYAKVTYYEFLWGRGARFINNGALLINGQFGEVITPFADPIIFNTLINEDFNQTIRFKTVGKIWSQVDNRYKAIKFENGYKISTLDIIKPKLALVWRLLMRYSSRFAGYGSYSR
jgi:hypothetical protein